MRMHIACAYSRSQRRRYVSLLGSLTPQLHACIVNIRPFCIAKTWKPTCRVTEHLPSAKPSVWCHSCCNTCSLRQQPVIMVVCRADARTAHGKSSMMQPTRHQILIESALTYCVIIIE